MMETTELQQTQKPERQDCGGQGHFMPSDLDDRPSSTVTWSTSTAVPQTLSSLMFLSLKWLYKFKQTI